MIETVHPLRAHTVLESITVPTLPDCGGAVVHGIEPARIAALEEKIVGDIHHPVLCEGLHQDRSAQETGLQALPVILEILAEPGDHTLLRLAFDEIVLQREESRGLHRIEDIGLETAIFGEELPAEILPRLLRHALVPGGVAARGGSHIAHQSGIDGPV